MRAYLFALYLLPAIAAAMPCPYHLDRPPDPPRVASLAIAKSLDAAFSPILNEVARELNETTPELVNFSPDAKQIIVPITDTLAEDGFAAGYDGVYKGAYQLVAKKFSANSVLKAPFTRFNQSVMSRLNVIVGVVDQYIERNEGRLREFPSFTSRTELLAERTFAGPQVAFALKYGNESVLYSVAMLTASPLGKLTPEQVFRAVIEPQGTRPSLVVQLALALPPNRLGVYGGQNFRHNPLAFNDKGQVILNPQLKKFLKLARDPEDDSRFKLGVGCPVARGALQTYLDAIAKMYLNWPT